MKFIMMVGPSYSGKSFRAEQLAEEHNAVIFSSDAIREEIYGDAGEQKNPGKVFDILHRRLIQHMRAGGNAIYDATNLSCKRRMGFLKMLKNSGIECEKIAMVMIASLTEINERMQQRAREVPGEVVVRQIGGFQMPYYYEGWNTIMMVKSKDEDKYRDDINEVMYTARGFNQNNPHHSLGLTEHMIAAFDHAVDQGYSKVVQRAALYHDLGKIYTKTFVNSKGETTDVAHYYGHEGWSTYLMMMMYPGAMSGENRMGELEKFEEWMKSAVLVQWHMAHYVRTPESMETLYQMLDKVGLGKELKRLERCDKEAH